MLRVSGVLFLLGICIFFGGCSMHGAWRDTRDMFVGTKFDPDKNLNVQAKSYYRRFVPAGGRLYYRMDFEPPNIRYYIQWSQSCRYSLLVSPDSTIISWRYEDVNNPSRDCVTS